MDIRQLLNDFKNETVILIDLSWLLYRSYYAYKDLTNRDGEPTGQYYGLTKTIQQLSDNYDDALILLVDDGAPLERKQLNESYKANREHTVHFEDKKNIVDCLIQPLPSVYRIYNPIAEADDLLFTISRIKDFGNHFIIYTSDKDLYQAVDDTTLLSSEISGGRLILKGTDSKQYIDHFNDLHPRQVPYFRAVVGDPSDNLKIIRPRFPSKIAYYFAKNYIKLTESGTQVTKPDFKPADLTDKQYEALLEIYASHEFITNLNIMKLDVVEPVTIIDKDKSLDEVHDTLLHLELNQYDRWLAQYLLRQVENLDLY